LAALKTFKSFAGKGETPVAREGSGYEWFKFGDINGFFGLMFDNVAVLSFFSGALILGFNFPSDVVYLRMFPGTTFGVLCGDLLYTWMAFRLAKKTGNRDVTAMPLGLDTPSTIGLALTVIGPAFLALKQDGQSPEAAAIGAWHIGMATMVIIGVVKFILSFCGPWVQKMVPRAGLLGSIAGVGLALIGYIPLLEIFETPVLGMLSLGIVLYSVVAGLRLPKNLPGVFSAIVIGTVLYHVFPLLGLGAHLGGAYTLPSLQLHPALPRPSLDFIDGLVPSLKYLPIAIPFAILTVVGGINVTESARVAGDDFNTRQILLTEAVATLIAGICGGVAQSCPYIGHPAYKRMGARSGYTILVAIFIGVGGMLGFLPFIVELIPKAILAPILVFVALEITSQAFLGSPAAHASAVVFAIFPTVARLLAIQFETPQIVAPDHFQHLITMAGPSLPPVLVTIALGNGFILTGMLWGAFLAEMIDRRLKACSLYLFILAALTFFGVVHSSSPDANVYLPWLLTGPAQAIAYQFSLSYLVLGILIFLLSFTHADETPQHINGGGKCDG
jgi:adenine/guanine/hypoxanthine permease